MREGFRPVACRATLRRLSCASIAVGLVALAPCAAERLQAQERFSSLVGPVRVEPVPAGGPVEMPFIIWGGDVATFHANGGLTTKQGSLFAQRGWNLKLVPGDNFVEQVRRYMSGKSPFLRGTTTMIGLASEVLGSDPRTKPVVFMQMTWSAGDHMVGRGELKNLDGLKGKRIALQKGGPHVGMLDDVLRATKLTWKDIIPVWADDLTGPKGPATLFRNDASIDACFVVTPDMIGLTGGLDSKGSGAEGTVKDSHVVISTATMSRSIADVYACRKDYFDANKAAVEKLTAGYLKACEELLDLKKEYTDKGSSPKYMQVLKMAQSIYGTEVIPTLEVDAHGLVSDATFVLLPGNVSFFTDKGNLDGFERKQQAALDLAVGQGYASVRQGLFGPDFDYKKLAALGGLTRTKIDSGPRIAAEAEGGFADPQLDENTILSFTIQFEPNQTDFSADLYGSEFQRAIEAASTFGNAVVVIRGHSDPTKTLVDLVKAGMAKGLIRRSGASGNYTYYLNGKPLNLEATEEIVQLIEGGAFAGAQPNPQETMQAALNLSRTRAEAVRDAVVHYAQEKQFRLDSSQIQPAGIGVRDPLVAKPKDLEEAKKNMRVEFRLIKVPAEVVKQGDFDF